LVHRVTHRVKRWEAIGSPQLDQSEPKGDLLSKRLLGL